MLVWLLEGVAGRAPFLVELLSKWNLRNIPWDETRQFAWWQGLLIVVGLFFVQTHQHYSDDLVNWIVGLYKPAPLPMKSNYKHERSTTDWVYLNINKFLSIPLMWHMINCCIVFPWVETSFAKITIWNTLVPLVLLPMLSDLPYYFFHRALHSKLLYQAIHKHHHLQITPTRGLVDAQNTHPFEYFGGAYCNIFAYWAVPQTHCVAIILNMVLNSIMSALNHTRNDIRFPFLLWEARDHDIHHRFPDKNFGQYVTVWDYFFGSTRRWFPQKQQRDPARWGDVREVSDRAPKKTMVIGANGLVGKRLVEMLLERGGETVFAVDIADSFRGAEAAGGPLPKGVEYTKCNICDADALTALVKAKKPDAVIHTAALVGPYHPKRMYEEVNYKGVLNVIRACRDAGVARIAMAGSPSSFFDGADKFDFAEDEGEEMKPFEHLTEYSRTKAEGERVMLEANGKDLRTCVVSPHQVYGNDDRLFVPALMEKAKSGLLRVMGDGENLVSFTHADNCCHALILAVNSLADPESPSGGQRYFVTDGGKLNLWDEIDAACEYAGFGSIKAKMHVPVRLLYLVAYASEAYGKLVGKTMQVTPFSITMMTIHRSMCIDKISRHLGYKPVKKFEEGWREAAISAAARLNK